MTGTEPPRFRASFAAFPCGVALLGLVLAGCAAAHVHEGRVLAYAIGHARVETCDPGAMGTPGGAFAGACVRVAGGDLSTSFVGVVSLLVSGAVAYFSAGVLW
jgi:hypothetical protein